MTVRAVISYIDSNGHRQLWEARYEDVSQWTYVIALIEAETDNIQTSPLGGEVTQIQMYRVN